MGVLNLKFKLIILIVLFLSITAVSAGDFNQTDSVDYNMDTTDSLEVLNDTESGCCSFIIQEENNETVYGFRQDSPLNGYGVRIKNETWHDMDIIREDIDTEGSYFTHCIITENGWIMSQGGSQYDEYSLAIEAQAFNIINSTNISMESLTPIQDVLKELEYGHVLIKSPDGQYGVVFYDEVHTGILLPGEFLVVPNMSFLFRGGNYTAYDSDPLEAILKICYYDNSGWSKRNLYTYHIKPHEFENSMYWGVDTFASNDNGHGAGLNISNIVTYFYYNDEFFDKSIIPELPDKIYAGTHIFKNQKIDKVFELADDVKNVLVEEDTVIHYKIYNINSSETIAFSLDENLEFVDANISYGNYSYDENNRTVYFYVDSVNYPKDIFLKVRPKAKGNFTIRSYIEGTSDEMNLTLYATDYGAVIHADDVEVYKGYSHNLIITLTDLDGRSLVGENVSIQIGGNTYVRKINSNGFAAFVLMLDAGEYDAVISYDGIFGKNQTNAHVIIKQTLFTEDVEAVYSDSFKYSVSFIGENGEILPDGEVDFRINGRMYDRYGDENGNVQFSIQLDPGNYTIRTFNGITNEFTDNNIVILPIKTQISVKNLQVTYNKGKYLTATLKDANGIALSNVTLSITIGSKTYYKQTDSNGQAKLLIKLLPKTYTAKITFAGNSKYAKSSANAKIVVKKAKINLYAKSKVFKATKKEKLYSVTLKNNVKKSVAKVTVKLTVKGKTYIAKTNKYGKAIFKIKKLTKIGTFKAKIRFAGNKYYSPLSKTVKIKVKK